MLWAEGRSELEFPDHIEAVSDCFDGPILKTPVEGLEFVDVGVEVFDCF